MTILKELNCTKNQQFELFSTIAKKVESFSIDELQSMKLGESDFNSFSKKFYTILYKGEEWEKSIINPLKKLFDGFQSDIPNHFNSFRDILIKNKKTEIEAFHSLRETLDILSRMILSEKSGTFESGFDKTIVNYFIIHFNDLFGFNPDTSPQKRKKLLIKVLNNVANPENYEIDTILENDDIKKIVSNKWFQEIILKLKEYLEEWDNFISSDESKSKLVFETTKEEFCFVQKSVPGNLLVFDFNNEFNSLFLSDGLINLFSKNSKEEELKWVKKKIDNWHKALQNYILDLDKLTLFSYLENKVPLFLLSDLVIQNELLTGDIGFADVVQLVKQIDKEDGERMKKIVSKTFCS